MNRKRKPPAGAKPRSCPDCHQVLGLMTEKQWQVNRLIHNQNSVKHLRAENTERHSLGEPPNR